MHKGHLCIYFIPSYFDMPVFTDREFIIYYYYYYYYYYYLPTYLLQLSCHSVALVLTLNKTKTQYKQYKTQ